MIKHKYLCIGWGLLLSALLLLVVAVGIVAADPANSVLQATVSNPTPLVGDRIVVSFTLTAYDSAEIFNDWRVRLNFNPAMLTLVPGSCTANPAVWASGSGASVGCVASAGSVRLGEGNFAGTSAPAPLFLGTVAFTVTSPGTSDFVIANANPYQDTGFSIAPTGFPLWSPATLIVQQAYAGDRVWTGATDANWDTAANWDPASVPGATDAVVIPGGLSTYPVLNTNASVYSLTIAPGAALNIPDTFALTAESVSNYGTLVITRDVPDATLTPFHLYNSGMGVSYFGAEITANGAMNVTQVAIRGRQECTSVDEPGDTVDRCFDITPGQAPTDATVALYYLDSELDGQTPGTMQAWHWNSGTMTWTVAGSATPGGSAPDYYVSVTGVTDFSPFVLKSGVAQPTAVHLQGFAAFGGLGGVALVAVGLAIVYPRRKRKSDR